MTKRIGLVGYGVGGRLFHAPYIRASAACELAGIVARADRTVAAALADHPDVPVVGTLDELVDLGVDAVVVSTPPATRRSLVLAAVERGVAVVADKPFAPTAAAGQLLVDRASERRVLLNVFHNRRRDTDVVTAQDVIASGALGTLRTLDLRIDQDDPATVEPGPDGGLLRDLGSHVVDQALLLLGPARAVTAQLGWADVRGDRTDVRFALCIEHTSGARSRISASKLDHLESKELRLAGDLGSYVSDYSDVQFEALRRGERPGDDRAHWGFETEERWGTLRTAAGVRTVPSSQGDYTTFYDDLARALAEGTTGPVPAAQGVAVLAVLDAAVQSDAERRAVEL